ncbi:MAG: VWA domain-containing protein [Phycisphaerae bacterium]
MDIQLDRIGNLHLLWVVLALIGVWVFGFARKAAALRTFASANLVGVLTPRVSRGRQIAKAGLSLAALVAIVIALMGPRWGVYWEDVQARGLDLMICLDVSRSMMARDVMPSRLERARQDIRDLVSTRTLSGDRVGLVAFAGMPVLKCPLTIDYGFYRLVLDDVGVNSAPRGGTNLGDAVRLAAESFDDTVKNYKAIIVISDGEDQESYPVDAARKVFTEKGVRVFTIGLGDANQGARIPVPGQRGEPYLEHEGQQVWSKMNPETLQQMALAGGGAYVPAGTQNIELDRIYREKISTLEKRQIEAKKVQRYYARYQIFAAAALALLAIETLTREVRPMSRGAGVTA